MGNRGATSYRVGAVVLLGLLLAFPRVAVASAGEDAPSAPASTGWVEIDQLLAADRLEEALPRVEAILGAARAAGDGKAWTWALLQAAWLRESLYPPVDAARFLHEQPRPSGAFDRAVVDLHSTATLVRYLWASASEIDAREKVESAGNEPPFEQWTHAQLAAATLAAGRDAWSRRQEIGELPVSALARYLQPNGYPPGVRGTVRDALSYLYAGLLVNRNLWSDEETVAFDDLDLPTLIRGEAGPADRTTVHPVREMAVVLGDLEAWHLAAGRREAAFEARRTRVVLLHDLFTDAESRRLLRQDLEENLKALRDVPWWSMGMATLAEQLRWEVEPGSLARAHAAAVAGRDAWPGSPGGERCRSIVDAIEAPGFKLRAMASDGLGRRSIEVNHKNLGSLYFRAYPEDPTATEEWGRHEPKSTEAIRDLVRAGRPVGAWRSELAATPDFAWHVTWVVPPLDRPGGYLLVASNREDFSPEESDLAAVRIVLSDLVLLGRDVGGIGGIGGDVRRGGKEDEDGQEVEVMALSGTTGEPIPGVEVRLYGGGSSRVLGKTGAEGILRQPVPLDQGSWAVASSPAGPARLWIYNLGGPDRSEVTSSLLYTDRAVYRPGQKILWKVLVYRGSRTEGHFRALEGSAVTVKLQDPNSQEVASLTVTSNDFGTAAGEFQIPAGPLLGSWKLQTSMASEPESRTMGSAEVEVEEYKRPTFEVVLDAPAAPLRLDAPAKLSGRAVYYFGLPVTRGQVRWRVTSYGWNGIRTVASGTAAPGVDGRFEVAFTPRSETRHGGGRQDDEPSTYDVSAEVTDAGGETRETEGSFQVGRAAVAVKIVSDRGFLRAGRPAVLTVTRQDLNGRPRPGAGSWSLYELRQPAAALLPGDELLSESADASYRTPGDAQSPRWKRPREPEEALLAWPLGARRAGGELRHRPDGVAVVRLPPLPPGAYRVLYSTVDDFGTRVEARQELLVAGPRTALALPAVLRVENTKVRVGGTARLLVHSGFPGQTFFLETWRGGRRIERRTLHGGESPAVIERPIGRADRGGLGFKLFLLRDHQLFDLAAAVEVPWDRELRVELTTFRDHLRPGARETWKITVRPPQGEAPETAAAEVLAAMTDRSLELFAHHNPPDPSELNPDRTSVPSLSSNLAAGEEIGSARRPRAVELPELPIDRLLFPYLARARQPARIEPVSSVEESITVTGGPAQLDGRRVFAGAAATVVPPPRDPAEVLRPSPETPHDLGAPPRRDFAETAFWQPHLRTGPDGTATIEFTVPDSATAWDVFVQAVTRDLRSGTVRKEARSARDLLVHPYLPRFLREGDRARLEVVVTNGGTTPMRGEVALDVTDPESGKSVLADFGFPGLPKLPGLPTTAARLPFTAPPGGSTSVVFPLTAPRRVGSVDFRVTATAGDRSDGELRPLPVLPSRVHLAQSRFAVLHGAERRELHFPDLERNDDPTRLSERLVVTVDGQLFEGMLAALPYLVHYPHECAEQTLNRFLSTGIVTSLFDRYPGVAKLAANLAKRETGQATWDAADPNRELALEETPFLEVARGGDERDLLDALDPRIARAQRDDSLAKLTRMQLPSGAFPWWPGGPASPYMTAYVLLGLSRAIEFGAPGSPDLPEDLVRKAWSYLAAESRAPAGKGMREESLALSVLLNYAASSYPAAPGWDTGLTEAERRNLLDTSFAHWTELPRYPRSLLALTLQRMGRPDDARRVFDSVLDRAKTTPEEGTFWAPEERSWLWYNDPIESHAFALRALLELRPDDPRRHGLVQWLFLHKELNHWKSTRATAEVLYAVARYLEKEKAMGVTETATVQAAGESTTFTFAPDRYTGKVHRVIVPGARIDPAHSAVTVEKETPGFLFAAATWHFSTEAPPATGSGDLFHVSRRYFLRVPSGGAGEDWVLKPLDQGTTLKPGDEVEVQLTVSSREPAEYVQLRDPRPAGLEPGAVHSGWTWASELTWYEETRDSASNFFFEALPAGEHTLKYRLRVNLAGEFRVGPATVQSMYAPELVAYSGAGVVRVGDP